MRLLLRLPSILAALLAALALAAPAGAQGVDRCLAVSQAPSAVLPAALLPAALKASEARLTFIGHATWLIESAGGISIATDYNDYIRPTVHRHHEPCAHHALLHVPRSRNQAHPARMEPG